MSERIRPPMACNCSDEGKADCDALRAEVCAALKCEPDGLVNAVVHSLNWDLPDAGYVTVTAIPCDMWSAVRSEYTRYKSDEEINALPEDSTMADEWLTVATMYAQCDRVEDGFALTWKTWKEWFEEKAKEQA